MEALIVSTKIHESHVLVHKIKSDYLPTQLNAKQKWCCKTTINNSFLLTIKLVYKLINQEDKAHSMVQVVDFENIMKNEHDKKIKVDNLPSSKILNIPLV
jgi:hypothetical protein